MTIIIATPFERLPVHGVAVRKVEEKGHTFRGGELR